MPKVDFFTLPRFAYPSQTKTFTDARAGELTLTLRALNAIQRGELQELAQRKAFQYRELPQDENGEETGQDYDGGAPPEKLMVGGEPVSLNDELTFQAASLTLMQCGEKADRYTFEEFVAMAINAAKVWRQILVWRNEIIRAADKEIKKPAKHAESPNDTD